MFDIKALRAHIERKFEGATVDTVPSPHIEISDFFPQEIYDNIRKYNIFQYTAGQEWIAPGVGCFCAEHGTGGVAARLR